MPVSKKRKHPKKRNKRTSPAVVAAPSGYVANISFGGFDMPDSLTQAFHEDGEKFHARGREDRANGLPPLSFEEFLAGKPPMPSYLKAFEEAFDMAAFAQYIDGFEGKPYSDRVIFQRDDI